MKNENSENQRSEKAELTSFLEMQAMDLDEAGKREQRQDDLLRLRSEEELDNAKDEEKLLQLETELNAL